jgi:hypothetical protein
MANPVPEVDTQDVDTEDAVVNGVNVRTGGYAVPSLPARLLAAIAERRPLSPQELAEVKERLHRAKPHLGVADHIDPRDLSQAGWGVVFAKDDPDAAAAREALQPLLETRREQAGKLYREFVGGDGVVAGEPGRSFLARNGSAPGPVDPERGVPYYLLIVGSPERVPFDVQTDFGIRHAVGRLDLGSVDALAAYAEETVRRESPAVPQAKRAAIYATRNRGDVSTQRSARLLAEPLAKAFTSQVEGWTLDRRIGDDAKKDTLRKLLHDESVPSILFSASHGARVPVDDPKEQRAGQGALVTQEWPGPMDQDRPLTADELFSADDLLDSAQLGGMIAVLFACYSAGTPANDEFLPPETGAIRTIAPAPFVARLPQRMLARGAGAVIGHVERAWTTSFRWPGTGGTTVAFESLLHALACGARVGAAAEHLTRRYVEVSTELTEELRLRNAHVQNDDVVAGLWTAQTDARNFIILGDPAVRLAAAAD